MCLPNSIRSPNDRGAKRVLSALYRCLYLSAMFLGVRAGVNQVQSWLCGHRTRATALDGSLVRSTKLGDLEVFVHPRLRPGGSTTPARYGLLSVRQVHPRVGPWLYRYLCLTSHFGCGHLEIAFYENSGTVTIYGVRNIARANAHRLGLREAAEKLLLSRRDEARMLLHEILPLLAGHGLAVRLAAPCECVALSVNRRLLHPSSESAALDALRKRYEKLQDLTVA